ncbi:MAG: DUF2804 domain-containing protein [Acholeplasmataceae bacterium]|jgi:hypothetical protein|nr:DUF2804 domain-containing protein [Acholeplasmataceae bacterium]
MKQRRLSPGPLLNEKGDLLEAGYATSLVKTYKRSSVKVKGMRIKEWDYYYIGDESKGIAFTVADNSYMWLTSVTLFDFINQKEKTKTFMGWFPNGKLHMPETSKEGDVRFTKKNHSISFIHEKNQRHLKVFVKNFDDHHDLTADLILKQTIKDTMVIATPFQKKGHFYYNQKINLLKASGQVTVGDTVYNLNDAYGVLDWGRGVWTYHNTWYWSSLSGIYEGKKIGFNLGYGFGDTRQATENMLFYEDQTYKLDDIIFDIPKINNKDDFMSPWKIISKDHKIDLTFTPILDRHSHSNVIFISSNQHQVFGKFSGSFQVSENKKIEIHDMIGFAEKVMNKW